ncbi:hypothetical protein [Haloplanus halobius]|uniref:hypothetical protein n=1 Tax=Haloplanus halobius TaxID=2934938 RepID=UPI00200DD8BE|nr:hypothetical protein [Haloplanus sp. XH21]
MSLDVDPPAPPELTDDAVDPDEYDDADVVADADYRREELEAFLRDGAWADAFAQWAADTDLDEADWRIVRDLDMLQEFDFFWDDFADRVGYHAPGIPEDWKERDYHPDIDSWKTVSSINASLTELGQLVCEVLKDEWIDWEAAYDAPDDLPEF